MKKLLTLAVSGAVLVFGLTALAGCSGTAPSVHETPEGEDIVISLEDVGEQAQFYSTTVDGTPVEILAIRASDGTVRTALNTCQVCFDSGRGYYVQDGSDMVCQNCKNRFPADAIGVEHGGCNPVPLTEGTVTKSADSLTIASSSLGEYQPYFTKWKK